jgi:hypothetical protein
VNYWAEFNTSHGAWTTIDLPFASFVPRFRGTVIDAPPLDAGKITGMGLMIYDKQDGDFEVRLADISALASLQDP